MTMSNSLPLPQCARKCVDACLAAARGGDLVAFVLQRAAQGLYQ